MTCVYFFHHRPYGKTEAVYHVGITDDPVRRQKQHRGNLGRGWLEVVWDGMSRQDADDWERYLGRRAAAPVYGYRRWIPRRGIRRWNP